MAPRKRGRDEIESSEPPKEISLLSKLRNMWEFACVMQYIFTFGTAVKIDENFDIEDFESECMKSSPSEKLEEIGLTLLKWISSHRGLTHENWDEYTRRQYVAKAPRLNPYGTEEQTRTFRSFDIFQKIRVLHQLTVWTFWNPDRLRERMPEQKEADQNSWRIEELGWDRQERSYFVLDDSRLYRRTEPPLPVTSKAKPKSNTLKAQAARRRANKRRRIEGSETPEVKDGDGSVVADSQSAEDLMNNGQQVDTLGGYQWECVAVNSEQYQDFLKTIEKSRDPNEKDLSLSIIEHVLPVVEKAEESYRRKLERKQKALLNAQKLSGAKRSSRLADKQERDRQEREAIEAAEKHATELAAAHREEERQAKLEQDRQSRMMTREQRIKDREYKRLLHEEELARVAEEAKRVEAGEARGSERYLKAQMEKHKRDLEDLSANEDWVFDCSGCGIHGKNVDDGAHSVACESCNVWQHSQCLGIRRVEAEKDDFHFVCKECMQKIENAQKPNIKLKFRAGLSSSPPQAREKPSTKAPSPTLKFRAVEVPVQSLQNGRPSSQGQTTHPPIDSPHKLANGLSPSPYLQHAASKPANSQSPYQTPAPPNPRPLSTSAYINGSQREQPMYPYPLNPPNHQSSAPSLYTNGHAYKHSQHVHEGRPASAYSNNNYSSDRVHQSRGISQQPDLSLTSTPQVRPTANKTSYSTASTPTTHHPGRLPSPVLNRPSMSPTQGNADVGPLAGIPHHSATGSAMSPPSQSLNHSIALQYHNQGQAPPYTNGAGTNQSHTKHINSTQPQEQHQHQHQKLSGLSPTKHSPNPPAPSTTASKHNSYAQPTSSTPQFPLSTATAAATATSTGSSGPRRSISGTLVFPPTELLHPSPKQLSKSPVPAPSKALTPAAVVEGELRRGSEEIRDMVDG